MRRTFFTFVLLAVLASLCASNAVTFAKDKPVSWKIIDDALFRVNDAPVKEWGVYQTAKKRDPLLVQMDKRFLLVRIHDRQIFEVDPAKVQIKPDELLWDPSDHRGASAGYIGLGREGYRSSLSDPRQDQPLKITFSISNCRTSST